ncbi:glycosyltransferase family 4 protein [Dyella flagellata]|uniref:Biofilm formation protein PslI n=1 Tax=Dyella flagellata TaxID=1867833 RepID=A0ABQ5XFZ8_9GAMM|nr:glycosyltransferase family 1 protein [Dyella flagellata]GLQ89445.1 biofilm formation protein PslI [Dyella flagellata]
MRVGLDYRPVTVAPSSGIARQVLALERALQQHADDLLLRFTAAPLQHPHRQFAHCPIEGSPLHGLHRPAQRLRFEHAFLPEALRAKRIQLYIATANSGLPIGRRPVGMRQVLMLHDVFQLTLRNRHTSLLKAALYCALDRAAIRYAIARADAIWVPSRYTAKETTRMFPAHASKLRVLPNAVAPLPDAPAPASFTATLPGRYWLVVGSREPRKNIAWFLRVWHATSRHRPSLPQLLIVGAATDVPTELRHLPGLHWRTDVDDVALAQLYRGAERLWQPSYAEGFGLPVVEALSCGTPVAVAQGSALDEVTPLPAPRFDPHDGAALARLMMALDGAAPELSAQACRAAAAAYTPAAYTQHVGELLEEWRR